MQVCLPVRTVQFKQLRQSFQANNEAAGGKNVEQPKRAFAKEQALIF
jgi:hypothetical protein